MAAHPRVSEAELQVMQALWVRSPATAGEIVEALTGRMRWKPRTIKTLIARLVRKKVVGFVERGKAYEYYPLVDEGAFSRDQIRSFLRRFTGGSLKPILAAFIEQEDLSSQDIAELRKLLDRKKRSKS